MTTPAANVKINAFDNTKAAFATVNTNLATTAKNALAMASSLTGIGATGVGIAMMALTRNAIEYGSALTDSAKAANISVESLQVLRALADKAGASHSVLDKALISVQKSAMDSANGLTTYSREFDALNIDVQSFIALPAERKLETMAKAMDAAENKNVAYSAAIGILGRRNAPALMEVLQDLAVNGFDEVARAAHEAGQIMSTETAQSLDAMADAMEQVKRKMINSWSGFVVAIANDIPALRSVNTEIVHAQKQIDSLKSKFSRDGGAGNWFTDLFGDTESHSADLAQQLRNTERRLESLKETRDGITDSFMGDTVASDGGGIAAFGAAYENAVNRASTAQERLARAQMTTAEETIFLQAKLAALGSELSDLADERGEDSEDYQNKLSEVFKAELDLHNLQSSNRKEDLGGGAAYETALNRASTAQEGLARAQMTTGQEAVFLQAKLAALGEELSGLADERGEDSEDYQNKLSEVFEAELDLHNLQSTNRKEDLGAVQQWRDQNLSAQLMIVHAMQSASDEMTDAFMSFFDDSGSGFDEMISSWLQSLARMTFQQGVSNPLMQWFSDGLGSMIGGGTVAEVPQFHTGGIIGMQPDEVPIIGKRGEEVLTESDPRHRNNLSESATSQPVEVTFHISSVDASGIDALLMQRRPMFVGMINEALNRRAKGGI